MAESLDDDLPNGWKPPAYTRQRCPAVLLRRCELQAGGLAGDLTAKVRYLLSSARVAGISAADYRILYFMWRTLPPTKVSRKRQAPYAASSCRRAIFCSCSPDEVSRRPLMRPMRVSVSKATGSHNSAEAPAASSAIALCSSSLRSLHEIPSITHPR